jgi:hypothetical protein
MKTKLLALALLAGGSMFAQTRFTFSVGTGGYNRGYYNAAPAPYVQGRFPCPGPDYFWNGRYWERQQQYGYQAQRGYYDRDQRWDRDRDRDRDHDRDHDRDFRRDRDDGYRNHER